MAIMSTFPPSNTISPSVRITEKDQSFYDIGNTFHRAGLIGFASKGPIGIPTQITSQTQLTSVFGHPHPEVGDPYLIYAATQYLTVANELWVVRVADTSPVSWEHANTASVDVPSSGGQVLVESSVEDDIVSWDTSKWDSGVMPTVTWDCHANTNSGNGNYSFAHDMYFRWKLNNILSSKTLHILADCNRPAPFTGRVYTANQLVEDLNSQLGSADGIEFYCRTTDDSGNVIPPGARKITLYATNSFGPSASIELVSVIAPACGGAIVADGGTNVLGLGTDMTRAITTSQNTGYPIAGSLHHDGTWDFSSLGSDVDLSLQVVIDGTDSVLVDNVVQIIDLNSLKTLHGGVVSTADVVYAINNAIHTATAGGSVTGGFQAVGGRAGGLGAHGALPVDDLAYTSPKSLTDSTYTNVIGLSSITLMTNMFGADAKLFVKPESTANAYFGFLNTTAQGTSPPVYSGDLDVATGGVILGSENIDGETTFTITADSPGIDGNYTSVIITNDPRQGTFSLDVYNNGTQVEVWGNLTKDQTSRFYVSTFVSIVSDWIRVNDVTSLPYTPTAGTYNLAGGSDGIPADPDDQDKLLMGDITDMSGMYALSEPEQVDIDLIAVPGHCSSAVMEALISLCAQVRMDCMAIIDPPFGLYVEEVVQWHNGIHPLNDTKLDSDFAALYWPWVKVRDGYNAVDVWVPPSGSIMAVYAQSDGLAAPWYAPAGLNRGMVPNVEDVFDRPTLEERDLMYGWRNAVNPIIQFSDIEGFVVWGQKTLQRLPTALDRVNVRRMMFVAEKQIRAASRWLLFEPHDDLFHQQFINMASGILDTIQAGRGLHEYRIQADWTLNTPDRVDRNEFWARIGIQPTKAVEFMFIEFSIHKTDSWDADSQTF